jgi:hypothetical protein
MKKLTYVIFLAFACSCGGASSEETSLNRPIERPIFEETKASPAYESMRPEIQSFTIDNSKPSTVSADKGTEIRIPENCFTDKDGKPVTGEVQLEIVEAFSMTDIISSGLTTLSDGELIQSNGMLFIDAKSNGQSLNLAENMELDVNMPTMGNAEGFQMFTGDGKNWTVDSTMIGEDYLIPLPLELLYPKGNATPNEWWFGNRSKGQYIDTTTFSLTDPKFENTSIATREFRNRIWRIMLLSFYMSIDAEDVTSGNPSLWAFGYGDDDLLNQELWSIYYDHPTASFAYLDSLTDAAYKNYFNENKDILIDYSIAHNKYIRKHHPKRNREESYMATDEKGVEAWFMAPLDWFNVPENDRRKLKTVKDYGVDLNAANAYDQLKAKGVNPAEIRDILSYQFKRQNIIKELQREKDRMLNQAATTELLTTTAFSTSKLGWINCDRFFNDETAAEAEILVSNSSQHQLDFIDFSLVIPEINARLMSFLRGTKDYAFTKEEGPYTKLPIGKPAVIVGVSIQDGQVYYGSQQIYIADSLTVAIAMQPISKEALNDSLDAAVRPVGYAGNSGF